MDSEMRFGQQKDNEGFLKRGNRALLARDYASAVSFYLKAVEQTPVLSEMAFFNLTMAREKFRGHLLADEGRKRVLLVCADQDMDRVNLYADLYKGDSLALLQVDGPSKADPSKDERKALFFSFAAENILDRMFKFVIDNPVHVVQSIGCTAKAMLLSAFYKVIWGASIRVDLTRDSLAEFRGTEVTPSSYVEQKGRLPSLSDLDGRDWTRIAFALRKSVDQFSCNSKELQAKYGGRVLLKGEGSLEDDQSRERIERLEENGLYNLLALLKFKPSIIQAYSKCTERSFLGSLTMVPQKKPVVVYETHNFKLQGAPNSLFEIAKGVHSRGHFRAVVMSSSGGPLADLYRAEGIECVFHGISQRRLFDKAKREVLVTELANQYKAVNASLIHVNTLQNFHCVLAASEAGIPCIWNIRESESPDTYYDYLDPELRELAYSCFEKASKVIFVADATKALWEERLRGKTICQTIRNGIDISRLKKYLNGLSRAQVREEFRVGPEDVLFLSVGTVSERKGQLDLIEAFARLPKGQIERVVLAVVGFNNSDYSKTVRLALGSLKEKGLKVIEVEESEEESARAVVAKLYAASDVFVLTSRIESYPRVILEAMEFGLAIISTPCFGVKEQLVEDQSVLFYDTGNADALASRVSLLIGDGKKRQELARAANERLGVINNYTSMLDAYEGVYSNVLKVQHGEVLQSKGEKTEVVVKEDENNVTRLEDRAPVLSILVISRTVENIWRLYLSISENGIKVPYEILCSWNGSEEDCIQLSQRCQGRIKFHEKRPYNFAKNNNGLAKHAKGDYLLLLNDDVVLDAGAVQSAYRQILNPGIGMVGINLRYQDGRLQHAGVFFDEEGKPYHRYKHKVLWDDKLVSSDEIVPCITGAFVLIRRKEFLELMFDEEFRVCGEDIALNLSYRERFEREILYHARATAVHIENATRKKTAETKTPPEDMERILSYSLKKKNGLSLIEPRRPKVRIVTEKPGWIMYRKAEEIQKALGAENVRINEDWSEAQIHYYINYGYFRARPKKGLVIANFTHFDPDHLADKFVAVAQEVDHCVAVSVQTADILRSLGVPEEKITVIVVGADSRFAPKLTVGVMGRVYPGGRKGEDIVQLLARDEEITKKVRLVSAKEGWGLPVWNFEDSMDFYNAIDYLLIPSRIEGGPVPFMEALACGTLSVAPEIGVIPQFPHISYPVGDVDALKKVLLDLAEQHLKKKQKVAESMRGVDWAGWAVEHEKLFRKLLAKS